jgi:formamidopyrimidine-DNA glycosylase
MPELPEVETIARDLKASIVGARVAAVWGSGLALHLGRAVDLAGVRRISAGRRILDVRRKGKFLLVDFDGGADAGAGTRTGARARGAATTGPGIVVHLGMSGRLRVEPIDARRAPHTHVAFALDDRRELRFVDPRRFGWLAPGAPVDARPELAGLGPDPLTELDEADLARRLAGVRAPIKAFLLDQKRIAGLGNIYVSEALHRARIHPTTPAERVRSRAKTLLAGIRAALELGIRNRGTTLRDYVDASGVRGNNAASLRVYGRQGEPCPICAETIRRRVDAGRSTFFCPGCQGRGAARTRRAR